MMRRNKVFAGIAAAALVALVGAVGLGGVGLPVSEPEGGGAILREDTPAATPERGAQSKPVNEARTDQVVLQMQPGATYSQVQAMAERLACLRDATFNLTGEGTSTPVLTVTLGTDGSLDQVIQDLSEAPEVVFAQKNYVYRLLDDGTEGKTLESQGALDPQAVYPGDPDRSQQWYLDAIGAYDAWSVTTSDQRVTVAVIDSGIDMNHPDLADNIVGPYDAVGDSRTDATASVPDGSPDDELGHGTHVAGIACGVADNGIGISGVSYNANVMPIKVFYYSDLSAGYVAATSDIAAGFNYLLGDAGDGSGQTVAQKYNVRVINMSLGSVWDEDGTGEEDQLFLDLIDRADAAGILVVCAAGNDDEPLPYKSFPSDYETCVSVMALSDAANRAYFSNYGPEKDICAPGARMLSTVPSSYASTGYAYMNGTSMASPVVAGASALLFAANPSLTTAQAKQVLYSTATDLGAKGKDSDYGYGALNLATAAAVAQGISNTPVTSIGGFPTQGKVGQPLALYATVYPAQANQQVIFTVKDAGITGAALSQGKVLASHEGTAVFCATVVGGNADGSNYVQEFSVLFEGSDRGIWNGTADVSWYDASKFAFEISTPEQLAGLAALVNGTAVDGEGNTLPQDTFQGKTLRLGADMYFNEASVDKRTDGMRQWIPIGDISNGGQPDQVFFDGVFDGQGHVLYNIYLDGNQCDDPFGGYQGLFGALGQHAVVSNVGLEGGWIFGRVVGGIAAVSHVETAEQVPQITGCFNDATITGYGSSSRGCGGIFGGENQAGDMEHAIVDGYRGACRISNCYNLGTINGYVGGPAGGIAGIGSVEVTSCYNSGTVVSQGTYVGSIVGTLLMAGSAATPSAAEHFVPQGKVSSSYGLAGSCANLYRFVDSTHRGMDGAGVVTAGFLSTQELSAAAALLGSAFVDNQDGFPLLYWQVGAAMINLSAAVIDAIPDQLYTGLPVVPAVTVRLADPTEGEVILQQGSDYAVICQDNVEVGMARLTISGIGRYTGTVQTTFQVVKVGLDQCSIIAPAAQWYSGAVPNAKVTVTAPGNVVLKEGRDYTVDVNLVEGSNNATITIAGACAGVEGSCVKTVQLVPVSSALQGSGTQDDPYLISSKGDLQFLANALNGGSQDYAIAAYRLTADIVAASTEDSAVAVDPLGVGSNGFGGTFDGGGHTITLGLESGEVSDQVNFSPDFNALALFPTVRDRGSQYPVRITNLVLDGKVSSVGTAAGFIGAGVASEIQLDSCVNRATVTCGSDMSGAGFIAYTGYDTHLSMNGCTNQAPVSGGYYMAGLVAELAGRGCNQFEQCFNQGAITTKGHGGGLVCSFEPELNNSFSFIQCSNQGAITSSSEGGASSVGGLLGFVQPDKDPGYSPSAISSCYNTGAITGGYGVGGLVGRLYYLSVDFGGVYNSGTVTCTNTDRGDVAARPGGLVGMVAYEGRWTFSSAYSAGELSSAAGLASGGLVGWAFYGTTMVFDHAFYNSDESAVPVLYGTVLKPLPEFEGSAQGVSPSAMVERGESDFCALLGKSFVEDPGVNEGRPVLFWQTDAARRSLGGEDVTVESPGVQPFTGKAVTPGVVVRQGDYTLIEGADYRLTYGNNVARGTGALVNVIGIGRYAGTVSCTFEIGKGDISQCMVAPVPDQFLMEGGARPAVTVTNLGGVILNAGIDYEVAYLNNTALTDNAQVVIVGTGDYEGQQTVAFGVVDQKWIQPQHVSAVGNRQYTGNALEPQVKLIVDGELLVCGQDYTATYANNVNVGQATIAIAGINRFYGAVTTTFTITAADLGGARIEAIPQQTYTGQAVEPPLEVWLDGSLVPAEGYTVAFANNVAVGQASVTVTGQGNYRGSRSASFLIVPAQQEDPDPGEPQEPDEPDKPQEPDVPGPGDGIWEGKGTAVDPYLIYSCEDLQTLSRMVFDSTLYSGQSFAGMHFRLMNDLSFEGANALMPVGYSGTYPFSGTFDGDGHTVTLDMNATSYNGTGLFGFVAGTQEKPARICNLVVAGQVSGKYSILAGVCGQAKGWVSFERCFNYATVSSSSTHVGGILGSTFDASGCVDLQACGNYGAVSTTSAAINTYVGGVVGRMHATKTDAPSVLASCYNQGVVSSSGGMVGGVAGCLYNRDSQGYLLSVSRCYNTGQVSTTQTQQEAGALFGGTYPLGGGNPGTLTIETSYFAKGTAAYALSPTIGAGQYTTQDTYAWSDAEKAAMTEEDMALPAFAAALGSPFVAGSPYPVIGRACKASFRSQPQSADYSLKETIKVSPLRVAVNVKDGTPVTYQWYCISDGGEDPMPIKGATQAVYQPELLKDENGACVCGSWCYYCVVTDDEGASVTSQVAAITVWDGVAAEEPVFALDLKDVTVRQGDVASLQVFAAVNDGGTISYQWYLLGEDHQPTAIAGATSPVLPLDTLNLGTARYFCVATNGTQSQAGATQATSAISTVTVVPYAISTAQQLRDFADEVNGGKTFEGLTVCLDADVNLGFAPFTPIGNPDSPFMGIFDGRGHHITGLSVTGGSGCALFGALKGSSSWEKDHAVVKNLMVFGRVVSSGTRVSAIAANAGWATLENVGSYVDVTTTSKSDTTYVGGLIGLCEDASNITIMGCFNAGEISSQGGRVGGLVADGGNAELTLTNCFSTGDVSGTKQVGGLVGTSTRASSWLRLTKFVNCYVAASVNGASPVGAFMGLAPVYYGESSVAVTNCYMTKDASLVAFGSATGVVGQVSVIDGYDLQRSASSLGEAFLQDNFGLHNGYPALAWETAAQPYVSFQPEGVTCYQGAKGPALQIEARPSQSDMSLSYQWYVSTSMAGRRELIEGATGNLLSQVDTTLVGTFYYSCLIAQDDGAQTWSMPARVVVCQPALAPVIQGVSAEQVQVAQGMGDASVSVFATSPDGGTLTYQWYRASDGTSDGEMLVDQTDSALNDFGIQLGTFYVYCLVTNKVASDDNISRAVSPRIKVEVKPFEIATAQDYLRFMAAVNGGTAFEGCQVRLVESLDLRSVAGVVPVGNQNHSFLGTFDGGGNTLSVALSGGNFTALFGHVGDEAIQGVIRNLQVKGVVSGSGSNTAGVVAWGHNVLLKNVGNHARVMVTGSGYAAAGLVGGAPTGAQASITLERCFNAGAITSSGYDAAGLVGVVRNNLSTVLMTDCYNVGAVKAASYAGGLYGGDEYYKPSLSFARCYNAATVQKTGGYGFAGALCGYAPTGAGRALAADCFYADSSGATACGAGLLDASMVTGEDLGKIPAALNRLGAYRAATVEVPNGGYPVLYWQVEQDIPGMLGDINNNGMINVVDAQIIYNLANETPGLWERVVKLFPEGATPSSIRWIADVNQDGFLEAADAFAAQRLSHGKTVGA